MGKYEPLGQFLRHQKRDRIAMSFTDIERVLKAKLPASKSSRAFWSNNIENNVMTRVWVEAGFETSEVSPQTHSVVFKRKMKKRNKQISATQGWDSVFGCMKGMVQFSPGFDATAPVYTQAEWQEIERAWSENWDRLMQ